MKNLYQQLLQKLQQILLTLLIIELGDLLWYVAQATMALDVSFDEVIETNIKKLEKRYPSGSFDIYKSENRRAGDR